MTLQQLKYMIAIAEQGTLSKAAEVLYISQPSLSESLRELEKEGSILLAQRNIGRIRNVLRIRPIFFVESGFTARADAIRPYTGCCFFGHGFVFVQHLFVLLANWF